MSQLNHGDNRRVSEERIDDLSLGINLNVASLYFEAFAIDQLPTIPPHKSQRQLCPALVSNPIQHNSKSALVIKLSPFIYHVSCFICSAACVLP